MTPTFDNPTGLLWVVAAFAVTLLGIAAALWRRRAAARFADAGLLPRIAPGLSLSRGVWRAILLGGAAACLAVALMDPRAAEQTEQVTRRGADVIFVVDVSRSMLAEDASPNRLERARAFISDAIDAMGGDRAGLIDFAGVAALRAPLTLNYDALKGAVDGLETKDSRRGGSMLGDAIRLAAESFPTDDAGHAIVVLSDGEDMGSDPVEAAKEAAERGIRIVTVGIGDPREGARVPVGEGANRRFLVHEGQEVWSRMDAATLRDVAEATGGLFVPAGTAQVQLGEILARTLEDMQRTDGDASVVRTAAPLFQWPAGLALLLLVAESVISARARSASPAAGRTAQGSGASGAQEAPSRVRRRRRAGAATLAARATPAAIAACVALAGVGAARADAARADEALAARGPARREAAPAASGAATPAPADGARRAVPDEAPAAARRARSAGRGQIDRDAFRDAVARANDAMRTEDYAAASAAFAEAMAADPTSAAAAYNRGVAEYRAGKLDEAASSFAEAASRADASLAADAMFNQGNATYQSALRALDGGANAAGPATQGPASEPPAPQPDLKAATEAVSQALTHYKDAIAANPADVDSRANAELAHTLLKQLREMQKQQEQQQDKKDQEEQKDQDEKKDQQQSPSQTEKNQEPPQDPSQCDNPKPGDGSKGAEGKSTPAQGGDGKGSDADQKEPKEPRDPNERKDTKDGSQDTPKRDRETEQDQRAKDPEDGKDPAQPDPKNPQDQTQERDAGAKPEQEKKLPEGELKANGDGAQSKSQQQPAAPAQARRGEPVPGAPLTKAEAERLLQGVRDRAKQRMEAKERAERVRQVPATRDW